MKTICMYFVAAMAVMLMGSGIKAQSSIGIRGGVTFSAVDNFPVEGQPSIESQLLLEGNYSAISFEVGLAKAFAIQPEVTYLQKGAKFVAEGENDFKMRLKMDYLEVPVLAKLRMGSGGFRGYLVAGPSVGYALNGKSKVTFGNFSAEDKIEFDDTYGLNGRKDSRFDLSAIFGGGIQQKLGIGSLVLDARVAYDFNDYFQFEGAAPDGHEKTHWESINLSIGYQFEFGGK